MSMENDALSMTSDETALITIVAAMPDRIDRMLSGIDEDIAQHQPSPEKWCITETVIHLNDVEPRYRARLERIVSEDNPQVPDIWPRPMPDPLLPLRRVLANYRHERNKTVEFLSTLAPAAWERSALHATLGTTTVRKQVQNLLVHDENHLHQMAQVIKLVGKQRGFEDFHNNEEGKPMAKNRQQGPGKGLAGGQYKPLTNKQVEQIHKASLAILKQTGVQVENAEALRLFEQAGASIEGNRVRLSAAIIDDMVDQTPSRVVLAGRNPDHDLILEGARVYIGTGGAALQVLDLETNQVRPAVLRDIAHTARIVDALDNIHFYLVPVYPKDISKANVEINKYYVALANTTKHIQAGAYTVPGIRDVVEMSAHIVGGANQLRERPIISFITSWMVSPLTFDTGVTELLIESCRQRIPVVLSAAPMAGSTAPVTLAGMLAQLNAEQLAGVVLTQLAQPGCPVLMGPIPATANMRSGRYLGGSVELGLCNAAITQLTHFYQIPIYNSAGMTESKIPDIQAGIEKTQSVMQVALAGANFIHHAAGMLEDMSTIAYEQFVIDNELLGLAMRAVQGIEINDDTLALDTIDRVGPGGHYLTDEHTLRYMRHDLHYPSAIFDRRGRDRWEQDGATDAWERARTVTHRILAEHKPEPLDPAIDSWIRQRFASSLDIESIG